MPHTFHMVTDEDSSKTKEQLQQAALDRSLGWLALWWIEKFVVHGPGDVEGEPVRHGDEYSRFIAACYAVKPNGRRAHLSAVFMRPKGCDKSGMAARIALFEGLGPARFAGFAKGGETYTFLGETYVYAKGEPMGKHVANPKVRLMATSEEQVKEIYDVIYLNLDEGPLSELKAKGMQVNQAQIELPGGGWIRPSTSGVKGKDGGKETFIVFDETHLYNNSQLKAMFQTSTRNMPKRQSKGEPWFMETTTMFGPGEDSVAELSYKLAHKAIAGKGKGIRILFDHTYSNLEALDNEDEVIAALKEAYGEAANLDDCGWIEVENFLESMQNSRDPQGQQPHRYFFNAITKQNANSWLHAAQLAAVTFPRYELDLQTGESKHYEIRPVTKNDKIALGFDGSRNDDSTALMGCRIEDNYVFPIHVQELPDGPEAKDWEVDPDAVNGAVAHAMKYYNVVAFFADPPMWETYVDMWEAKYGEKLFVKGPHNSKIAYRTNNHVQMATAVGRMFIEICAKRVRISDDNAFQRHLLNATRWDKGGNKYVIGKAPGDSTRKVDMAVASVLAHEAAAIYRIQFSQRKKTTRPAYQQLPTRIR